MLSDNELKEDMKLLIEQRKELEKTRQMLLKKGRVLLALNRHRRNQGMPLNNKHVHLLASM